MSSSAFVKASDRPHAAAPRRGWTLTKRILTIGFFVVVAALLFSQARTIDWDEVLDVIAGYPARTLAAAAALAAASHAIYASYDLLGRAWTRHDVPSDKVVAITFVSYAFNLNLGSLVGGFAFRYRLYSQFGLANDVITKVLGLSLATNWLGYLVLAGGVFALRVIAPPADWAIGAAALQALGVALWLAAAAYLVACGVSRGREWTVRGHGMSLPPLSLALLQMLVSAANWLTIAAVLHVLLAGRIDYPLVLGILLMAAVAGVIAHIPAGLGVLEAVFITLLGGALPRGEVLAALLAYRALYYLAPLLVALVVYLTLEARAKHEQREQSSPKG
jgi:glycosyltransferase 2 family protein